MVAVTTKNNSQSTRFLNRLAVRIFLLIIIVGATLSLQVLNDIAIDNAILSASSSFSVKNHAGEENDFVLHSQCPIRSISELSPDEFEPRAGTRHMVDPPRGGKKSLVCCETTKGHFSALLHHVWAPIGVARLLKMIESGYFSTKVPLYRCTDACQFGFSVDSEESKKFVDRMVDDPAWLPPGKEHRTNQKGIKRYPAGMWTYAGAGPNTRANQFVITLRPNLFMGGGSPWEVPLGEVVGNHSFSVLPLLYTGYGGKGPSQAILKREGLSEQSQKEWPLMDYIIHCNLLDEIEAS